MLAVECFLFLNNQNSFHRQAHRRVHPEEGLRVAAAVDEGRGPLLPPKPQQRDRRLQGRGLLRRRQEAQHRQARVLQRLARQRRRQQGVPRFVHLSCGKFYNMSTTTQNEP